MLLTDKQAHSDKNISFAVSGVNKYNCISPYLCVCVYICLYVACLPFTSIYFLSNNVGYHKSNLVNYLCICYKRIRSGGALQCVHKKIKKIKLRDLLVTFYQILRWCILHSVTLSIRCHNPYASYSITALNHCQYWGWQRIHPNRLRPGDAYMRQTNQVIIDSDHGL